MREKIERVSRFVHNYLTATGGNHKDEPWGSKYRWEHTLRVTHWAWVLAKEEKADIEKSVLSALLHDVSHFVSKDYRNHGVKSAEIARDFLLKEGYPRDFVKDVCYAIKSHVAEHNPKTVEAKILQDSDTLDRFGYFRILLFGKTADLKDLESLNKKIRSSLEYLGKVESGEFGQTWTNIGKEKVAHLLEVYKTVYTGVLEELESTRAPETCTRLAPSIIRKSRMKVFRNLFQKT